ncbi:UPF0098 protein [Mycobacterium kansasii]|uniref:UPF0098 protein n=1 Tax=Mycobacterium kansasii TaxID=1768 RepID=A0A7G1IAL6_MYCKA|nr:UPF0098 protein [Mycobacterium kansasii]
MKPLYSAVAARDTVHMKLIAAHLLKSIAPVFTGLALVLASVGHGGDGAPDAFVGAGPADGRHDEGGTRRGPLTISSPAFADGAPIPVQYTCKGANIAPPLSWSAPLGAALVVDDPDAVGGNYVHWIVIGIPPGAGSSADGQTPAGGTSLPNSGGQAAYSGPCPPPGTGTHHYRFTLYQLPATLQLPRDWLGYGRLRR